jgi:hypothetical protein
MMSRLSEIVVDLLLEGHKWESPSTFTRGVERLANWNPRSHTTRFYSERFAMLQPGEQRAVRRSFYLWQHNRNIPGLNFEQKVDAENVWGMSVTHRLRVLGLRTPGTDEFLWFWCGQHGEYDDLLRTIVKNKAVPAYMLRAHDPH